jgi:hypothetical protein
MRLLKFQKTHVTVIPDRECHTAKRSFILPEADRDCHTAKQSFILPES